MFKTEALQDVSFQPETFYRRIFTKQKSTGGWKIVVFVKL